MWARQVPGSQRNGLTYECLIGSRDSMPNTPTTCEREEESPKSCVPPGVNCEVTSAVSEHVQRTSRGWALTLGQRRNKRWRKTRVLRSRIHKANKKAQVGPLKTRAKEPRSEPAGTARCWPDTDHRNPQKVHFKRIVMVRAADLGKKNMLVNCRW